jgi:Transposase DDE domain
MCQSTFAIYCFLDDLLKAMNHKSDVRERINDAQVATTAVIAMLFFGGNYQKSLLCIKETNIFSDSLSRSRFSRRLNRLSDLLPLIFNELGNILKELNWESRYAIDSFPVAMCQNIRIKRNRLTKSVSDKESYRGYSSSKRVYFFGVRVQVITTIDNVPVEFSILPGDASDLQGLAELPFDFDNGDQIAADAAYTEYNWEDFAQETEGIKLLVMRKKGSLRGDNEAMKYYKFWLRHRIETTFGEISKLFPKKIHATNLNGFIFKVFMFLLAFQLDKAFIQ